MNQLTRFGAFDQDAIRTDSHSRSSNLSVAVLCQKNDRDPEAFVRDSPAVLKTRNAIRRHSISLEIQFIEECLFLYTEPGVQHHYIRPLPANLQKESSKLFFTGWRVPLGHKHITRPTFLFHGTQEVFHRHGVVLDNQYLHLRSSVHTRSLSITWKDHPDSGTAKSSPPPYSDKRIRASASPRSFTRAG